jgi:cell division septation protein DedD
MEEPLKARLIGATVLVVLAVALVPELLSGPKQSATGQATAEGSHGTRTYTIDLGGAVSAGSKVEPRADAPSARTTPALPAVESPTSPPSEQVAATSDRVPATTLADTQPADTTPEASKVATSPGPATVADTPVPAPVAEPRPSAPAAKSSPAVRSGFSVQVGAFGSEATARKLVNELQAAGFPAYISPMARSGKTLHRVRVGPAADRAEADKLASRLKARGLPVSVVSGG